MILLPEFVLIVASPSRWIMVAGFNPANRRFTLLPTGFSLQRLKSVRQNVNGGLTGPGAQILRDPDPPGKHLRGTPVRFPGFCWDLSIGTFPA
jgi:hypothetical protein